MKFKEHNKFTSFKQKNFLPIHLEFERHFEFHFLTPLLLYYHKLNFVWI
jgi:hypothetical protein